MIHPPRQLESTNGLGLASTEAAFVKIVRNSAFNLIAAFIANCLLIGDPFYRAMLAA